jgi:murein DD-endopeptidase MepM/ murein hydrolase activator NlpD
MIKNIRISFIIFSMLAFISTVNYWNNQNYGLILSYKGKEIAKIKSEELKENIQPAVGLYVDNEFVFATKNKDFLRNILSELKQKYVKDKNLCSSFVEDVRMDCGLYPFKEIISDEEAKELILSGKKDIISYEISENDNWDLICEKFNTTIEKIKELNNFDNEFQPENLSTINIETFEKIIHVKYSQMEQKEVQIAFESIKTEDPSKFTTFKQVTQKGINGLEVHVDEVTYINDEEVTRVNISRSTIKEKIDEQIIIGTKKIGDNNLLWPVPYTKNISSPFGQREDGLHTGIDISSSGIANQDVVACSGGTVTHAGDNNNGYGNYVTILHENGKISTLYAHCSKLSVKCGDKVTKGQKIAEVGSTGKSTGNHLHFEVRLNNNPVDPEDYLVVGQIN